MKIMLIGLGPHAKRIYMKIFKNKDIIPELVVDLKSNEKSTQDFLNEIEFFNTKTYYVRDKEKDLLDLSKK